MRRIVASAVRTLDIQNDVKAKLGVRKMSVQCR